ncbi:MAG: MFS transporter [Actinomycetota bacterium]
MDSRPGSTRSSRPDAGADPAGHAPVVALSARSGRAVIAAAVFGSALAYMSDDMLNVALPTLADDLDVGVTGAQWVVNGYFVTMLSLMLVAGSIGDIRGHRRTFLEGLGVFTLGAVVCASAPVIATLVVGRAIQGVGAALVLASGLALVHASFGEEERSRAIGLYMGLTAVSTAVGPMFGGVLVDVISWRAIFVAPLVFPVLAAVITVVGVPEAPTTAGRRPDAGSAGLALVTIAAFSVALIGGPADWLRPEVLAAIAVAVIGGVSFVVRQRRADDPMLPLGLFGDRTFAGGNVITLVSFTASAGVFFFVVVHLQSTLGFEAAEAGAALVPLYAIMLIGSPLAGHLADQVGAKAPIAVGLVTFGAGAWWLSTVQAGSGYVTEFLPGLIVLAVGLATFGAPLTAATLGAAGEDEQGIASGVNNTVGQMGGLVMIAVLPVAAGLSGASFEGPAFADGYETAMRICALLALASAVVATVTIRTTGAPTTPRATS